KAADEDQGEEDEGEKDENEEDDDAEKEGDTGGRGGRGGKSREENDCGGSGLLLLVALDWICSSCSSRLRNSASISQVVTDGGNGRLLPVTNTWKVRNAEAGRCDSLQ